MKQIIRGGKAFNAPGSAKDPCDRCKERDLLCQITPSRTNPFHPYEPGTPISSTRSRSVATSRRRGDGLERNAVHEATPAADRPLNMQECLPSGQPPDTVEEGLIRTQYATKSQGYTSGSSSQARHDTGEVMGSQERAEPLTESQEAALTLTDFRRKAGL